MTLTVDSIKAEGLMDAATIRLQTSVQATAASTLSLTVSSAGCYIFTGSTAGQIVKLGDATTYQAGHSYIIHNSSSASIDIQDNGSNVLFSIGQNQRATVILQDISTSNGVWTYDITATTNSSVSYWIFSGGFLTWSDDTGADLVIRQASSGSAHIRHIKSNGTLASPTATTSGQTLGGHGFYGWNSGGQNSNPSAEDSVVASENHSSTAFGGDRIFSTVPNGTTTLLERMRLSNDGNLLIGTSSDNALDLLQLNYGGTINFPVLECFDDLDWTTLGSGTNPHSAVAVTANGGATTVEGANLANDYFGRISIATGTTNNATGHAVLDFFNSVNKIRIGGLRTFFETRVMVPNLSGTPAYTVFLGLQDGNAVGAPVNGIYFTYTNALNSGQWVGITRSASTSSSVNSTVAVTANVWYTLRAEINAAGTSVSFFVNNVLIGTSTTNIPVGPLRLTFSIDKSSSSTTSRICWIDYVFWRIYR